MTPSPGFRTAVVSLLFALLPLPPVSAQKVTLVAVGDICLARGVEARMKQKGSGYPFAKLRGTLSAADVAFGNLECCLATGGKAVPKKYNFRGAPSNATALQDAGFDVVSLANNHTLDFGKPALAETMTALDSARVSFTGAGRTIAESHTVTILRVRGVRIGFLAYLGLFPAAVPLKTGEPAVAMADLAAIARDIKCARKAVDILIVSMHAGTEYTFEHSPRQEQIAHAAIDAGAGMVIGHHPHVVQDQETYKGRPIFYSLGNFVFDPSPTFLKDGGKRWSGMVVAELEKGKPPVARLVDLRIVDRQPRFTEPAEAAAITRRFREVQARSLSRVR